MKQSVRDGSRKRISSYSAPPLRVMFATITYLLCLTVILIAFLLNPIYNENALVSIVSWVIIVPGMWGIWYLPKRINSPTLIVYEDGFSIKSHLADLMQIYGNTIFSVRYIPYKNTLKYSMKGNVLLIDHPGIPFRTREFVVIRPENQDVVNELIYQLDKAKVHKIP